MPLRPAPGDIVVTRAALTDDTATLLDLDRWSVRHARRLLAGLSGTDRTAVDQAREEIVARVGDFAPGTPLPSSSDTVLLAAYLEAAPTVADWMIRRGIAPATIAATLGDLGRHLRLHRAHTGAFGFDATWWLATVLSGTLFQLGRLQFRLRLLRPDEPQPPVAPAPWLLDVHIPEAGPLTRMRSPGLSTAPRCSSPAISRNSLPEQRSATPGCSIRIWPTNCRPPRTLSRSVSPSPATASPSTTISTRSTSPSGCVRWTASTAAAAVVTAARRARPDRIRQEVDAGARLPAFAHAVIVRRTASAP